MIAQYPDCPNPDRAALERVGAAVRARLAADPGVEQITADRAELWGVADFVTPAECASLMAMIDRTARPSEVLDHGYTDAWRTSYSGDVDRADPFVHMIERRIDDLLGVPHEWGETLQGQRYEPGQQFREHMDWFWTRAPYWRTEAGRGGQRALTAMVYLNAVDEGGETSFPNLGLSVPPQPGTLLVWNNACPDGALNNYTLHAGLPVVRGVKYIVTKWYRTRKWG